MTQDHDVPDSIDPKIAEDPQCRRILGIDTIVVDPEYVVEHYVRNRTYPASYDERTFKLTGVRTGGEVGVSAGVDPRDQGGYYDGKTHPIWVSPSAFIDTDALLACPSRGGIRSVYRRHTDTDLPENPDKWPEEHVDGLNEMFEEAMDEYRSSVRHHLRDELTFTIRADGLDDGTQYIHEDTYTVDVRYEDDE